MTLVEHLKIGFIGAGNMTTTLLSRLFEEKVISPAHTWVSNRTPGKLTKLKDQFPGLNIASTNEDIIDHCQVIFLAMKPQDFSNAIEPIASLFDEDQLVISLLAGVSLDLLEKTLKNPRLVRIMPNTPAILGNGVVSYCLQDSEDHGGQAIVEELLAPLGHIVNVDEGDMFDTLLVSTSSGVGFIFELMTYWQDWIEERGFSPEVARQLTIDTFLGTALLARHDNRSTFEDLQGRVASKKGITAAGLDSMRELEIERALRISFEKAWMRNHEIINSVERG